MGTRLRITPGWEALVRELGLDDPRQAERFSRGEVVVDSGSSRVLRFQDPRPAGGPLFLKVYRYYRARPVFTYTYRRSRARSEYEALRQLDAQGIPVPTAVAYGSHRVAHLLRSCFLLTRGIEGARDLDRFIPGFFSNARGADWLLLKRSGLDVLAELVRRMHASGFFDGQLHFRNILIRIPEAPEFWFIDHPKARVIRSAGSRAWRRARARDFACLEEGARPWFSRAERLRFLVRATGHESLDEDVRRLVREVGRLLARQGARRARKRARRARRAPREPRGW